MTGGFILVKIQDIVPVNINFESDTRSVSTDSTRNTKPKLAVRLKRDGLDIAVYNGCNLYILEAIIKAMNSHDR